MVVKAVTIPTAIQVKLSNNECAIVDEESAHS